MLFKVTEALFVLLFTVSFGVVSAMIVERLSINSKQQQIEQHRHTISLEVMAAKNSLESAVILDTYVGSSVSTIATVAPHVLEANWTIIARQFVETALYARSVVLAPIHGHDAGDWLLEQVAKRMRSCLRQTDTPARVGGDEFIVLLPGINEVADAAQIAEKIRLQMELPFVMGDKVTLDISSSIGVVLFPDHAGNSKDLMKFGDEAMYQAKRNGRNSVTVFSRPELG